MGSLLIGMKFLIKLEKLQAKIRIIVFQLGMEIMMVEIIGSKK